MGGIAPAVITPAIKRYTKMLRGVVLTPRATDRDIAPRNAGPLRHKVDMVAREKLYPVHQLSLGGALSLTGGGPSGASHSLSFPSAQASLFVMKHREHIASP